MIINRMTIEEFRELGFLQELNRQFLHPLGLALEVVVNEDGSESFGKVWDCRSDAEGIRYAEFSETDVARGKLIEEMQRVKATKRESLLGYNIQPLTEGLAGNDRDL